MGSASTASGSPEGQPPLASCMQPCMHDESFGLSCSTMTAVLPIRNLCHIYEGMLDGCAWAHQQPKGQACSKGLKAPGPGGKLDLQAADEPTQTHVLR